MEQYQEELRSGKGSDIPEKLYRYQDASAFFGVIKEPLAAYTISENQLADIAIQLEALIEARKVRDWVGNLDVENRIRNDIEDYLYQLKHEADIPLTSTDMDEIMDTVIDVAGNRDRLQ